MDGVVTIFHLLCCGYNFFQEKYLNKHITPKGQKTIMFSGWYPGLTEVAGNLYKKIIFL
jgi:hypothetical protein